MAIHTVLITVIPRGHQPSTAHTLPVSVLVSPRLGGADRLGALSRLGRLDAASVEGRRAASCFRCGARTATVAIDTAQLRPDLWERLFNAETLRAVAHIRRLRRDHGVMSFSVRESLSALKAVYQEAGVVLALPDPAGRTRTRSTPSRSVARDPRLPTATACARS